MVSVSVLAGFQRSHEHALGAPAGAGTSLAKIQARTFSYGTSSTVLRKVLTEITSGSDYLRLSKATTTLPHAGGDITKKSENHYDSVSYLGTEGIVAEPSLPARLASNGLERPHLKGC